MRPAAWIFLVAIGYLVLAGALDLSAAVAIAEIEPVLLASLATAVLIAGRWPYRSGVVAALGLISDLNGYSRLGATALAYLLLALGTMILLASARRLSATAQAIIALPVSAGLVAAECLTHWLHGDPTFTSGHASQVLATAIYTWLVAVVVLLVWNWASELRVDRATDFALR